MIKFKIILLLCILSGSVFSQNLIKNGSIEIITSDCVNYQVGAFYYNNNLPFPGKDIFTIKESPDIISECAPIKDSIYPLSYNSVNAPDNLWGYHNTRTGTKMLGWPFIIVNSSYLNNYLGAEIISFVIKDSLENNKPYLVSFYVVKSNYVDYSTNAIDAVLSKDSILPFPDSLTYYSKVTARNNSVIKDTIRWTLISDTIIATGKEKYLHIGRVGYCNSNNLFYKPIINDYPAAHYVNYFLDDVSLTPIDTIPPKSNAGNDTIICFGDSVLIGGHNYADYFYTWWNNDSIIHRDKHKGKIWVKPDTNTWYYCRATDFRYDKTLDSIFVQVYPCKAANYNTTICKGDTVGLGNGKEGFYNFTWSPDYFIDDIHSNTPIANPPQTTMYYANYEDSLGRTLNDSILIEVINCDIPQIVNVYPVPTLNKITFEFNLPIPENTQIEIYEISGKLINFYIFDKYSNKRKAVVDLYKLEAGVYFYKIKYKQRVLFRDKLIKL